LFGINTGVFHLGYAIVVIFRGKSIIIIIFRLTRYQAYTANHQDEKNPHLHLKSSSDSSICLLLILGIICQIIQKNLLPREVTGLRCVMNMYIAYTICIF